MKINGQVSYVLANGCSTGVATKIVTVNWEPGDTLEAKQDEVARDLEKNGFRLYGDRGLLITSMYQNDTREQDGHIVSDTFDEVFGKRV
jgi:hypothetical protein